MFNYDPRISGTGKVTIVENIMTSFSAMYLTMISIVQGVAFGLLVYEASEVINWVDIFTSTWTYDFIFNITLKTAYIVTTFLLIVLTWHSYFWLAVIARWVPIIWDSILIFVLGAFEFMLIHSINLPNLPDNFVWFYLFAFIGGISGIQYYYNAKRVNDNDPSKTDIWDDDVKDLGKHIYNYKNFRAKLLWVVSGIFFLLVLGCEIYIKNSVDPIFSYRGAQLGLIIIILAMHLVMIFRHKKDQEKTLGYL